MRSETTEEKKWYDGIPMEEKSEPHVAHSKEIISETSKRNEATGENRIEEDRMVEQLPFGEKSHSSKGANAAADSNPESGETSIKLVECSICHQPTSYVICADCNMKGLIKAQSGETSVLSKSKTILREGVEKPSNSTTTDSNPDDFDYVGGVISREGCLRIIQKEKNKLIAEFLVSLDNILQEVKTSEAMRDDIKEIIRLEYNEWEGRLK